MRRSAAPLREREFRLLFAGRTISLVGSAIAPVALAFAVLDLTGALSDREKHYPRQLSGGQEQRVAIARAIVTDPTVLLADEPTGDLDAKSAGEVLTLLQRLNREYKKTIVMVTHDPHAAERATHLLHLEKGTLVEQSRVAAAQAGLA